MTARDLSAKRARVMAVHILHVHSTFALGGKDTHDAGQSDWVVLLIALPFALACALGHAVVARAGRDSLRVLPAGLVILAVTFVVGMALRLVTGRGVAVGFLVVAAVFLAVTMLGWRVVADRVARRRRR